MRRIAQFIWNIFDYVILLQMGRSYLTRFRQFRQKSSDVSGWRRQQQKEWERLSTGVRLYSTGNNVVFINPRFPKLGLLATMTAAILAITPRAPAIATTVWLGGAGLSVCGIFIVNYFPFKAFSIDDEEMIDIVKENGHYVNSTLLAAAIASPVIMTLWSAILFTVGIIDYIIETPLGGLQYTLFALIPIGFGVLAVVATLMIGWIIGKRVDTRVRLLLHRSG
jgi:hypothetical protein